MWTIEIDPTRLCYEYSDIRIQNKEVSFKEEQNFVKDLHTCYSIFPFTSREN